MYSDSITISPIGTRHYRPNLNIANTTHLHLEARQKFTNTRHTNEAPPVLLKNPLQTVHRRNRSQSLPIGTGNDPNGSAQYPGGREQTTC